MLITGDDWTEFDDPVLPLRAMVITVARPAANAREAPQPVLKARISWTAEPHTLFSLSASGEFVDDGRRSEAREFRFRDPMPSLADIRAKLVELKARFVTETAIRDHVQQEFVRLARLLGRIEVGGIGFSADGPFWRATVFISTPTGRREYGVLFEPFHGRLVSMGGLR